MKLSPRLISRFVNSALVIRVREGTRYMFQRHLLLTNIGISAGLSGAGDCIEQNYEKYKAKDRTYDLRRTFNMSVSGVTIGVVCHFWYIWLDKFLPGRTLKIAMKKMLIDQVICSPVTIGTFFVTLAVLEKSSAEEFLQEVRNKSWRLYLAEWVIWPPAQLINFFFLPLRFRVLYDNSVSMCYDIYTSYVKHELPVDEVNKREAGSKLPVVVAGTTSTSHNLTNPLGSETVKL